MGPKLQRWSRGGRATPKTYPPKRRRLPVAGSSRGPPRGPKRPGPRPASRLDRARPFASRQSLRKSPIGPCFSKVATGQKKASSKPKLPRAARSALGSEKKASAEPEGPEAGGAPARGPGANGAPFPKPRVRSGPFKLPRGLAKVAKGRERPQPGPECPAGAPFEGPAGRQLRFAPRGRFGSAEEEVQPDARTPDSPRPAPREVTEFDLKVEKVDAAH
ncbi:translation initiation factor IF-2-like [Perca fluviatilis]|uniref:translation initiation factor IF-2-like n=1 Tax=Perca fluviatilis TaxID=8168 RepID=UPI0019628E9C|nr:translation initiation factor IF-2-like [Perca fluviatilis]